MLCTCLLQNPFKLPSGPIAGVHFDPDFDDSDTCWHGQWYSDCNSVDRVMQGGCKWYHFHPDEKFEAHLKKFNEITKNSLLPDVK